VHDQTRRYFLGLLSFGAVALWATAGLVAVVLALLACAVAVVGSRLLSERGTRGRQSAGRRARPAGSRPLREEDSVRLVPDEPSLIIELG
jgi:hypothetical protein